MNPVSEFKTYPLYLHGEWVSTAATRPVINPATAAPFALVGTVGVGEVTRAIEDAHRAFESWRQLPGKARGEYLQAIAGELDRRRQEIARTITLENGKPLAQSLGEVAMSVDHLRWFAEEARRVYGRIVPPQVPGKRHWVVKTPMGVVAAISPWNFPLVLAVRKLAPALAAGCTAILKPASATPLCALALAECAAAAQLPASVLQVLLGPAAAIAGEFLRHPLCRKISFTGSTEVGRELIRGAAETIKPLGLELGGHAPVLVFEDARLEEAVDAAMIAKFRNTGQSCIAANRIFVQRSLYEPFLELLTRKTAALKVGDGLEEGVQIGPLIDQAGLKKAVAHIQDAQQLGARLLCGGRVLDRPGWFLEPTVLADVPASALCMSEETFAPMAAVAPFETETEAIATANASPYGLSAYAFTRDLNRVIRLSEMLEAGTIGINDGVPSTSNCPFGGVKQSGWGRELGSEGIEAFVETKHISIGLEP